MLHKCGRTNVLMNQKAGIATLKESQFSRMAFLFSGGGLVPPSVHMSDEGPDHASIARPVGTGGGDVLRHTAGLDTIFIQICMDTPPGVLGVSKEPEGHKNQYLDVFLR